LSTMSINQPQEGRKKEEGVRRTHQDRQVKGAHEDTGSSISHLLILFDCNDMRNSVLSKYDSSLL